MTGRGARDVLEREGTVRQALTSAIRRLAFLILLGGLSVLAASGQTVTEFPLSGGAPLGIAAGPDGNMWFTESSANKIGRITPDGVITEFPIPTANSRPGGITAAADGSLWFAEGIGRIGRITTSGEVTEFPIESDPLTGLPAMQPIDIAAGPDGDLWFTGYGTSVGRMTLAGHPTAYELFYNPPIGITAGPDGNVWFTVSCCGAGASSGESSVCRITSAGISTKFGLYGQFGEPHGITTGPDGNLWFTEFSADRISRIATSGVIAQFEIGGAISIGPVGIAAGPDGNLWFTESIANRIGRIDTAGVVIAEYSLPVAGSSPFGIAAGPDGNIWFTEYDGNRIGRITLPQPGSPPGRRRAVRP